MRTGDKGIHILSNKMAQISQLQLGWRNLLVIGFVLVGITGCTTWLSMDRSRPATNLVELMPHPEREFRGVWVATVVNIDWPSSRGLTTIEQKKELIALLDRVVQLNMNAVLFQVRPAADAFYDSPIEPWSEYLSGEMGKPPEPYYDPLAYLIEEAHKRGLEVHAWFNPFRARHASGRGAASGDHISVLRPDLVVEYGDQLWLDPGNPEAQYHSLSVVRDVVRRYDIDGVHIDDYFYPYPVRDNQNQLVEFPDDKSWATALENRVIMSREDWRRENINKFVESLYRTVKQEKSWVKVGISPFGIWRPGHPEGVRGLDAYRSLYADSRLWLQNGWVDYMSPQLYWSVNSRGQSFPDLYEWWKEQNTRSRHVWPGTAIYRLSDQGWKEREIVNQIEITRGDWSDSGNILFSMRHLKPQANRLGEVLRDGVYSSPALVPEMTWLYHPSPGIPSINLERTSNKRVTLIIDTYYPERVRKWVVRARYGKGWQMAIVPGNTMRFQLPASVGRQGISEVAVSAVGRVGQESPIAKYELEPSTPKERSSSGAW